MTRKYANPALMSHAEACFGMALKSLEAGSEPLILTFDTHSEMISFRQILHRWRHSLKDQNSPFYSLTIRTSSEAPWTITFAPRLSPALRDQLANIAESYYRDKKPIQESLPLDPYAPEIPQEPEPPDSSSERLQRILGTLKETPND